MPLRDHFRPPLRARRHWHAFHNAWATYLSSDLNARLPEGYFAEANVQFGVEISAAFNTHVVEVLVYAGEDSLTQAGAIELITPANKEPPARSNAFGNRCLTYCQGGVGLLLVDVVTEPTKNLHDHLLTRLGVTSAVPLNAELYAAAYRPVERDGRSSLDVWQEPLAVGRALPTMPLWLRGGLCLPVELEATYERTCREQRVPANGA
jgi:hypothetical protein